MSQEFFTYQDAIDTIEGINIRIKERDSLYRVPSWGEVVNAMSRYAYQDVYHQAPSIDEGMYEYVLFSESVDNTLRHECGVSVEDLIPQDATNDDAYQFNRRFSEWREAAIDTVSNEDDSPELRVSVLYGMSIDTVASFAKDTLCKIDRLLTKDYLTETQRIFWEERRDKWSFRSSFLEMSRRMSMDLSSAKL